MGEKDRPENAVDVTEHLWIPMPDGVRLAARLWLPHSAKQEPVPALLEIIPYRKADMVRARDERNHPFFAENGYGCLRVDMRGSGDSEGQMVDMYSDLELADTRHVILWLAEQPWCNGRVGMVGTSWGGTAALQANIDAPDALKAVIAVCATHDRYEDDIHQMGGCLLTDSIEWGATLPVILGSPPTPNAGDDWRERWRERLAALTFPLEAWLSEQTRGGYWRHGSIIHEAGRLSRPILAIGGWSDRYSNSVMTLLSARPDLVWGVVGPWGHHYPDQGRPGPAIGFQQLALAWWDVWLKGLDPAPPDWPRLRVWLSEFDQPSDQIERRHGRWVQSGPPEQHVKTDDWYLGDGGLAPSPSGTEDWPLPSDLHVGQASGDTGYFGRSGGEPLDQREDDARSLTFDTPRLKEDCILYGSAKINLRLRGRGGGQIAIRLNDVTPKGTSARIVLAIKNLALDEAYDKAIDASEEEEREICLSFPTKAYRLRKGHRLRLAMASSYWPIVWPSADPGELWIISGLLRLPLFQGRPADLKKDFPPVQGLPREKRRHAVASPPLLRMAKVESDGRLMNGWRQPYNEQFHAETKTGYGFETKVTQRIDPDDPSSAACEVEHRAVYRRPDGAAMVRCLVSIKSDDRFYDLNGHLIAEWEGRQIAERRWHRLIPRKYR